MPEESIYLILFISFPSFSYSTLAREKGGELPLSSILLIHISLSPSYPTLTLLVGSIPSLVKRYFWTCLISVSYSSATSWLFSSPLTRFLYSFNPAASTLISLSFF